MGVPIHASDVFVFAGDSITAIEYYAPAVALINANFSPSTKTYCGAATGRAASATGAVGSVGTVTFTPAISAINSGVGGNTAADIEADVPGRITNHNPTVLVLEIGVNDIGLAVGLSSYRASVDSIFTQTLAALPACKLIAISPFLYHETWGAGPVWAGPFDPPANPCVDDFVAQLQASVESFGGTYVATRATSLAYEAANNTPAPGAVSGFLTIDGLHPNATGMALWSGLLYAALSVVPQ